jgi:putative transposase
VRSEYGAEDRLSSAKVVAKREDGTVLVQLPLPMLDVMVDVQAPVEQFAARCGLLLMQACIENEVELLAGRRYEHAPDRRASRSGRTSGWAYFAGRKVDMPRQRVRGEKGQIALSSVAAFRRDGRMQRAVADKVLGGVKMRRYEGCLDALCEGYGVKRSSVSRHWVKASAKALKQLAERPLGDLDLAALVIDGVRFRDVCVVVALGVDHRGRKHILGLYAGATENATTCKGLLEDLVRRGLDQQGRLLFVIDGSKAVRAAIRATFGEAARVQRCQVHKKRNVRDHLPKSYHRTLSLRLSAAWGMVDCADAPAELDKTVRWLEGLSHSAAESLREGLEETLTLHRLGVPDLLRRSLSSTNLIESCFSSTRERSRSVKRWRGEDQVVRWAAATLLEAEKGFHRVRGYAAMPVLLSKLGLGEVEDREAAA